MKTLFKEITHAANGSLQRKDYYRAEGLFSETIEYQTLLRGQPTFTVWTDRAICRNALKKHEEALSDCNLALKCDPKCTTTIVQKGKNSITITNHYEINVESL